MVGLASKVEAVVAALLALALAACGGSGTLRPDEPAAELVVSIDSPLAVERLRLERTEDGRRFVVEFEPRRNDFQLRVVRIPTGTYRLQQVVLPDTRRRKFEFKDSPDIKVVEGQRNFLGEASFQFTDAGLRYRLRNRPARVLVALREQGAATSVLPLAFVGGEGDEWVSSVMGTQ